MSFTAGLFEVIEELVVRENDTGGRGLYPGRMSREGEPRFERRKIIPRKNISKGLVPCKRFEGGLLRPERISNEENYSLEYRANSKAITPLIGFKGGRSFYLERCKFSRVAIEKKRKRKKRNCSALNCPKLLNVTRETS